MPRAGYDAERAFLNGPFFIRLKDCASITDESRLTRFPASRGPRSQDPGIVLVAPHRSRGEGPMTLDQLLILPCVGLIAGFLASRLVTGHGYGVVGDIVVGILGAVLGWLVLGGWLTDHVLTPLGLPTGSIVGQVIGAFSC